MQCLSNSTGLESIVSLSLFQNTSPGAPHPTLHTETQLLAPPWRTRVLEGRVREERALSEWVRLQVKQLGSGWSPDFLQFFPGISNERSWRLPTWSSRLSFSQRSQAFHGSSHRGSWPIPLGGQWLSFFSQSKGSCFSVADPCWRRKHCVLCGMALSYGE